MRRLNLIAGSVAGALLTPLLAFAQIATGAGGGGAFETLLRNILNFTNTVLIPFIIGIGFLVFVWGMFKFFIVGGANEEAKEQGKSLMIYATLGFLLIIVFWGVVNLLTSSTGLQGQNLNNLPVVKTI
jgi:uncharacterized membrane protein YidH (DUF202 family)